MTPAQIQALLAAVRQHAGCVHARAVIEHHARYEGGPETVGEILDRIAANTIKENSK